MSISQINSKKVFLANKLGGRVHKSGYEERYFDLAGEIK